MTKWCWFLIKLYFLNQIKKIYFWISKRIFYNHALKFKRTPLLELGTKVILGLLDKVSAINLAASSLLISI